MTHQVVVDEAARPNSEPEREQLVCAVPDPDGEAHACGECRAQVEHAEEEGVVAREAQLLPPHYAAGLTKRLLKAGEDRAVGRREPAALGAWRLDLRQFLGADVVGTGVQAER